MASTYVPIATTTLGSNTTTVTFSSIPSTYTDLIMVFSGKNTGGNRAGYIQINGDTGSNYSWTYMQGDGSAAASYRSSNQVQGFIGNILNDSTNTIVQIMNYANTSTYKTVMSRNNSPSWGTQAIVDLWRSTSAISSLSFFLNADQWATGSTFTLYGIKAA